MRGLRIPLSGYALPAVAPRKKHERKPRTRQSVPGDPACAQTNHASDHVATPPRCQLTKIQLLVLPNGVSGGFRNRHFLISKLMSSMGWRSSIHMLFLRSGIRGLMYRKKWRGSRGEQLREAKHKRDKGRENSSPRRRWRGPRAHLVTLFVLPFSFVHVFNGYVASLSIN